MGLERTMCALQSKDEEVEALRREVSRERGEAQPLRLEGASYQASVCALEQENCELERKVRLRTEEAMAIRRELLECQRMLQSSEADVDASIISKEELLKTFQTLQSKHQVRGEELARVREELREAQSKLRLFVRGKELRKQVAGVGKALRQRF